MYREYLPSAGLRRSIACFWTLTSSGDSHRVLPDGCMDILLRRAHGNAAFQAEIVGTMTTAIVVDGVPGGEYLGVRFVPGEAYRFLALPAHHATDVVVPLAAAWGPLVTELEARVTDAPDTAARLAAIEAVLETRLHQAAPVDFRVRKALVALRSSGPLPQELAVGSRQLRRIFETYVGISPKVFARVMRMRRAVATIDRAAPTSWSVLATDCGYCDQSHLVREFQALVGLSPTTFARARAMSVLSNPAADASAIGKG